MEASCAPIHMFYGPSPAHAFRLPCCCNFSSMTMTVVADTSRGTLAAGKATRARSTVSCLPCQRRKQRCDRAKPCSNCLSRRAHIDCVYDPPKLTKRSRSKTETLGTWAAKPSSEESSPSSDEWTYIAERECSSHPLQVETAWQRSCISADTLVRQHQPAVCHVTELLKENPDVTPDDGLQTLIKATSSSFPRQRGLGRLDPFGLCDRGPMFDFLIQHLRNQSDPFFDTLPPSPFQYPFSKIWMPHAMKTEIGLLVTQYCAAVNFDKQRKLGPQPYTIATQSRLLNLLNEGLRSSKPFPDDLIMAVYSLMYLVASEDFEVHWKGLVTMVNARGGLGDHGISGIVGNLVSIADRDFAALFEREPRLSRPRGYGADTKCSPHINMDSPVHPLHRPHAEFKGHQRLPRTVADVLGGLRRLTAMVVETFSALPDITPVIDQECQRLLQLVGKSLADHFSTPKEGLMYEAVSIATRVYVRCISEGAEFSEGMSEAELHDLQDCLSTLSRSAWDTVPGLLLFIHLVAQPAARLTPTSRTYFLASQQRLVAPLALVMYPDTVLSLETFILVQRYIRTVANARQAKNGDLSRNLT
jgi:hypothetical protein